MTEKYGYNEVYHYVCDNEKQIDLSVREASEIMNKQHEYKQKVKETLQEAYNQNARHNTPIGVGVCVMIMNIAKELGVKLK